MTTWVVPNGKMEYAQSVLSDMSPREEPVSQSILFARLGMPPENARPVTKATKFALRDVFQMKKLTINLYATPMMPTLSASSAQLVPSSEMEYASKAILTAKPLQVMETVLHAMLVTDYKLANVLSFQ